MFIRICAYLKTTSTYLYIKYPRPQKINLNSRNQNIYNQIMSRQNLFNCENVYNRLVSEKEKHNGEGRWWADCLEWKLTDARAFKTAKASVTYIQCTFTDSNGNYGRPIIDCFDEMNQGSISPITEEEAEAINLESKVKVEARRDGKPYIKVKKYTVRPKTKEDGITVEELPGPEHESLLYKTIDLYNEAFTGEFDHYLETGHISLAGSKKKGKNANIKPLVIQDIKIRNMIHDTISETDPNNPFAGHALPNPSARFQLKHDFKNDCFDDPRDTTRKGLARMTRVMDFETEDLATYDGEPVKNSNIHKYIVYGCKFNARLDFGSVCCSSAGISNPIIAIAITVKQPEARESRSNMFDNLFSNKKSTDHEASEAESAAAPASSTEGPAEVPASKDEAELLAALVM